jgi:hypothetical protein
MNEQTNIPDNAEIDKALKEFEAKNAEQNQKNPEASKVSESSKNETEGVVFDTPGYRAVKYYNETNTPKVVQLMMKWAGVKEQKTAEYILLAFVVAAMAVSFYLFFGKSLFQRGAAIPAPGIEFEDLSLRQ